MKDLTGYSKKSLLRYNLVRFYFLSSFLIITLLLPKPSFAINESSNFEMSANFEHTVTEESVKTEVILNIESTSPRVISYYTATIPLEELKVSCTNFKTNATLECTTYNRGSSTDVLMNLNNSVVRPEEPLELLLTYQTPIKEKASYTFSSQIGDCTTKSVLIRYSDDLGEPLWTSDPIHNVRRVGDNFEVLIDSPTYSDISLLFGERVLYKFEINKVFSNSLEDENQTFEIFVPSDTPTQTIIWEDISPLPNLSMQDEDGNYIFKYIVGSDETVDCNITGYIQKREALDSKEAEKTFLTQSLGYWSINNTTEFKRVNNYLQKKGLDIPNNFDSVENLKDLEKELFYKYLYEYVTERLNYNKELTLGISNQPRVGANTLVDSPNEAGPTDYADFYIALLRNYNVPSRLAVGYISNITGYTSDGFYHHWVEYLDSNKNLWITADPFLDEYFEKDLFKSPFLDHIVILRRGKSPVAPKISFFQENDFIVNAQTQTKIQPKFEADLEFKFEDYKITDKYLKAYIYISNIGNISINDISISKSNISNISKYLDPVNNLRSQIILPKAKSSLQFNIPYESVDSKNLFVTTAYRNLDMYASEETLETKIEQEVPLYLSLSSKLLSILVFTALIFLIYFSVTKLRKILLKRN